MAGRHGVGGGSYSEKSFTLMDWNSKVLMTFLFDFFLFNSFALLLLTLRLIPYNIFEIMKDSLVWTDIVHTRNN